MYSSLNAVVSVSYSTRLRLLPVVTHLSNHRQYASEWCLERSGRDNGCLIPGGVAPNLAVGTLPKLALAVVGLDVVLGLGVAGVAVHQMEVHELLSVSDGVGALRDRAGVVESDRGAALGFDPVLNGLEGAFDPRDIGLATVAQDDVESEGAGTLELHSAVAAVILTLSTVDGLDETAAEVLGLSLVLASGEGDLGHGRGKEHRGSHE